MAKKGTKKSEKFNLLYHKYNNHKTYLLPCVGLADIIEKGEHEELEKYLRKTLGIYKGLVDNIVLGCTHYPLIEKEITKILGQVKFFNGASRLAIHLKELLKEKNLLSNDTISNIQFIDSQNSKEKEERFFYILNLKDKK